MNKNKSTDNENYFEKIVALCKRRGFVFPGSEIYGGLANTYDYGPMGVELLRNIKNAWWKHFVQERSDIYGLDSGILMSPKVWEASGHTSSFTDVLIDCKNCRTRTRGDHVIEKFLDQYTEIPAYDSVFLKSLTEDEIEQAFKTKKVEGWSIEKIDEFIEIFQIKCPKCGQFQWTKAKKFNLLFETKIGIVEDNQSLVYLRGEIAQGMFVNFKNVLDSMSPKLPFGLAQSGAAFRNEITLGRLVFRMLQFNLAEFEYFFDPEKQDWNELFEYWKKEMWHWAVGELGLKTTSLRWRTHTEQERSHYSKRTEDIEYNFPWGFKELYGLAYRSDFDLKNHSKKSGVKLVFRDQEAGREFIPHVIEPTFGMDRSLLTVLMDSYSEENTNGKVRVMLKIKPFLAPYRVAVFPLLANKPELTAKAHDIYLDLKNDFMVAWDDRGNIGKRYASQDEIGTPWCVTVDFQTLEDDTVTIRDRDTASQERAKVSEVKDLLLTKLRNA